MLCFKFNKNHTINDEFDYFFFVGVQNSFRRPRGGQGNSIIKIRKSLIRKGGPNTNQKFQHSSSIRKCLKEGETDSAFGVVLGPPRTDFKNSKKKNSQTTPKISTF